MLAVSHLVEFAHHSVIFNHVRLLKYLRWSMKRQWGMQRCVFPACHWFSGVMITTVTGCEGGEHCAGAVQAYNAAWGEGTSCLRSPGGCGGTYKRCPLLVPPCLLLHLKLLVDGQIALFFFSSHVPYLSELFRLCHGSLWSAPLGRPDSWKGPGAWTYLRWVSGVTGSQCKIYSGKIYPRVVPRILRFTLG